MTKEIPMPFTNTKCLLVWWWISVHFFLQKSGLFQDWYFDKCHRSMRSMPMSIWRYTATAYTLLEHDFYFSLEHYIILNSWNNWFEFDWCKSLVDRTLFVACNWRTTFAFPAELRISDTSYDISTNFQILDIERKNEASYSQYAPMSHQECEEWVSI